MRDTPVLLSGTAQVVMLELSSHYPYTDPCPKCSTAAMRSVERQLVKKKVR